MTQFLISDANPDGHTLEDILQGVRSDILVRCTKIADDNRGEPKHVLNNNIKILNLLSQAIELAEDSTRVLDKSLGKGGEAGPRMGDG
ncbi:MAG: histidine kinase [Rhodospirillaceae bacterium]|nr:histidine kinase [Rhodospirillaceae bacterium]HAA91422.1 histidine kinase [Rhodospirillaceae bacterium]|tara:strand:+ start:763 stop:1026 length:264 start_codon:yes stop_codon:yes gene_type:complete